MIADPVEQYSNAFVEQVSIVSIHIEKSILVKERAEGDRIMVHRPRNVESCYTANLYQVGGMQVCPALSQTGLTRFL